MCGRVLVACVGSFVAIAVLCSTVGAQEKPDNWGSDDDALFLPDRQPLPELPVRLQGEWLGDGARLVPWEVDLAIDGDRFVGKVLFKQSRFLLPLTVQGLRSGDVVEFSVRFNAGEVAHFAGNLAGTSLVGTLQQPDGSVRNWEAGWFPETFEEKGEEPQQ
jgi:hypothetical protein